MNYLFTICGRAGSKGLPGKNVGDFCGLPLAYYTIAAIAKAQEVLERKGHTCRSALNTDSRELADIIAAQSEVDVAFFSREEELSGDYVAKVTVICDTLLRAQEFYGEKFDYVVDNDLTAPLRTAEDILEAIEKKESRKDTDVVYSLCPARKNPYFNMAKEVNGFYEKVIHADYISRQETPPVYDMNASIYVYEIEALMHKEAKTFFNDKADAIIMKDTGILDIDCLEDKEMMEVLAEHYFYKRYEKFAEIRDEAKRITECARHSGIMTR